MCYPADGPWLLIDTEIAVELSPRLGIIVISGHVRLLLVHYSLAHDETCILWRDGGTHHLSRFADYVGAHVIAVMKSSYCVSSDHKST